MENTEKSTTTRLWKCYIAAICLISLAITCLIYLPATTEEDKTDGEITPVGYRKIKENIRTHKHCPNVIAKANEVIADNKILWSERDSLENEMWKCEKLAEVESIKAIVSNQN